MTESPFPRSALLAFVVLSLASGSVVSAQQSTNTDWTSTNGLWTNAKQWSAGLPTAFNEASIRGSSSVVIPSGNYTAARLNVGTNSGDHARITLQSPLILKHPYLTLDATGAPSPGITLRRHGIVVHTHDVVLRQFRIRIGDEDVRRNDKNIRYAAGDGEYALYFTDGSRNAIADHLSLSWSTNKILSTTKFADRITIQWCILSESLNLDGHGYASIAGGNRVTWHHNLFAHNNSRNPRFQGAVDADFRNNVVYDWGEAAAYGEFDRLNYVGNYLKPGPSTTQKPLLFLQGTESVAPGSLYFTGNILEGSDKATQDNWRATGFTFDRTTLAATQPFPAPPVSTEPAAAAYNHILQQAGATSPTRDAIDQRIIHEVQTSTGHIIESIDENPGAP